jgi:hypothetical protein
MRRVGAVFAVLASLVLGQVSAQETGAHRSPTDSGKLLPLPLRTRIPLPGVYGRIDHYGWDSKRGVLIVSALGNDTVEIVETSTYDHRFGASASFRLRAGD